MDDRLYIALIGDLVASRQVRRSERLELQDRLRAYFGALKSGANPGLAAQPLITLGEEFQALFHASHSGIRELLDAITAITELARPTAVRFGLGIGALTTALQEQALGMDGPSFHRARRALERARSSDLHCQLETDGGSVDGLWSTLASYALRTRLGWTGRQREAIELYEEFGAWNKVASALHVSKGAVSLRHQAAGWSLYRTAWAALENGLQDMLTPQEDKP